VTFGLVFFVGLLKKRDKSGKKVDAGAYVKWGFFMDHRS
jgi:hypothetical protein